MIINYYDYCIFMHSYNLYDQQPYVIPSYFTTEKVNSFGIVEALKKSKLHMVKY